ncbi:hypothetical protein C7N43_13430 [Sphingobacteriales bacterium UPWRP_1]|nr:hypothetical protein C7N43_13430 [Sphingobacteriales bacterium UPWRP_1]
MRRQGKKLVHPVTLQPFFTPDVQNNAFFTALHNTGSKFGANAMVIGHGKMCSAVAYGTSNTPKVS